MNSKMILVVDDDEISLRVISHILQQAGYAFVTAENGEQAWEILQRSPWVFALVLADRIMPKLHGLDLAKKMQQDKILKTIPVILLTGEADKRERLDAIRVGIVDFLYKPVEESLLLTVIKRVLKHT